MSGRHDAERRAARRAILVAVLLSLLVHFGAIFGTALVHVLDLRSAPPPVEEIELTILQPPPVPAPPPAPTFVETAAPAASPPEKAAFESDRNTAAASPEKAAGEAPVPTSEGRDQPFLELEQKELALAKPADAPPAPQVERAAPTAPPPKPPALAPTPPPEQIAPDSTLLAKREVPEERKDTRPDSPQQPPAAPAPPRPSYQRQARATRLRGSIDNSGRPAVAALSTPLGRYRKSISDAVGSSWYQLIGPRTDLFNYGTVTVLFTIDKDGKVHNPKVLSNTSNESFEIVTLESILAAEIPPIPADVLPTLEGGRIEIDFSFSIITN